MQNQFSANSKKIQNFRLSQKLGVIPLLILLVSSVVFSFWAYYKYQSIMNPNSLTKRNGAITSEIPDESIGNSTEDITTQDTPPANTNDSSNSASPVNQGPSVSRPNPSAPPTTSAPNNGGIPSEVSAVISSLESQGIKNNPNITVDTSSIPDGTTVSVDRNTWSQHGNDGSVRGVISLMGQNRNGTLSFTYYNNKWLISGYAIDS